MVTPHNDSEHGLSFVGIGLSYQQKRTTMIVPGDDDVLLGRGTGPNATEGNIRFRRTVWETYQEYASHARYVPVGESAEAPAEAAAAANTSEYTNHSDCDEYLDASVKNEVAKLVLKKYKESGRGRFLRRVSRIEEMGSNIVGSNVASEGDNNAERSPEDGSPYYQEVSDKEAIEKIKQSIRFQFERHLRSRARQGSTDPSARPRPKRQFREDDDNSSSSRPRKRTDQTPRDDSLRGTLSSPTLEGHPPLTSSSETVGMSLWSTHCGTSDSLAPLARVPTSRPPSDQMVIPPLSISVPIPSLLFARHGSESRQPFMDRNVATSMGPPMDIRHPIRAPVMGIVASDGSGTLPVTSSPFGLFHSEPFIPLTTMWGDPLNVLVNHLAGAPSAISPPPPPTLAAVVPSHDPHDHLIRLLSLLDHQQRREYHPHDATVLQAALGTLWMNPNNSIVRDLANMMAQPNFVTQDQHQHQHQHQQRAPPPPLPPTESSPPMRDGSQTDLLVQLLRARGMM